MDLHRFENNPNVFFDPNPHITDFFEIMAFDTARGTMELNGRQLEVCNNSIFFICPYQKKSCQISMKGLKGFHLVFQNDFLSDFFHDQLFAYRLQYFYNYQHPQYLRLKAEEFDSVRFALNEIISEISDYQTDSPHILRSLLYYSLSRLNRYYSRWYHIAPDIQSDTTFYQFKELLEKHIKSLHTVEEYCQLLGVSRHQLNTIVKKYTGSTPREVISSRLHQEIKTELRYTYKSIAEVAFELNFSDPNNLSRFFKKMEGMVPSEYRGNYQNDSY